MAQTSNAEVLPSIAGIRTFRNVRPGDGGKFDLSSPIGTTGIQNCVGMYIQLDESSKSTGHLGLRKSLRISHQPVTARTSYAARV